MSSADIRRKAHRFSRYIYFHILCHIEIVTVLRHKELRTLFRYLHLLSKVADKLSYRHSFQSILCKISSIKSIYLQAAKRQHFVLRNPCTIGFDDQMFLVTHIHGSVHRKILLAYTGSLFENTFTIRIVWNVSRRSRPRRKPEFEQVLSLRVILEAIQQMHKLQFQVLPLKPGFQMHIVVIRSEHFIQIIGVDVGAGITGAIQRKPMPFRFPRIRCFEIFVGVNLRLSIYDQIQAVGKVRNLHASFEFRVAVGTLNMCPP